jgi:glucosyl-3-phosphoglycerate synthase
LGILAASAGGCAVPGVATGNLSVGLGPRRSSGQFGGDGCAVSRPEAIMGDFFQNGVITTLHELGARDPARLQSELRRLTGYRPLTLVLPCLYSELEGKALPQILECLATVPYLHEIVVTLGAADAGQFRTAVHTFQRLPQKVRVLWNDGPRIAALKEEMRQHDLFLGPAGKGLAAWMAYGYVLGDEQAYAIALHDCDILTYDTILLHRLVYPIVNSALDYEFSKGYYARVTDRLHGRVTRIFVTPFVRALEKLIGCSPFLVYLDSFRYPLAGEFCMHADVARINRIPSNWGLEVGTLAEVFRNYSNRRVCQVDLGIDYDHKHQTTGLGRKHPAGLVRMAQDIASTVLHVLASEGVTLPESFFRSLRTTYLRCAQDAIRQYGDLSAINGLVYDRHTEDLLAEAFGAAIEQAGIEFLANPLGSPLIPNWNRASSAIADIIPRLREAVELDNEEAAAAGS